jgi:hypothetical protein
MRGDLRVTLAAMTPKLRCAIISFSSRTHSVLLGVTARAWDNCAAGRVIAERQHEGKRGKRSHCVYGAQGSQVRVLRSRKFLKIVIVSLYYFRKLSDLVQHRH